VSLARVGRTTGAGAVAPGASVDLGFVVVLSTGHRLEKVEVAAQVRLLHMLRVEQAEAAIELRRGRHPRRAACSELLVADEQRERP